MKKALRVYTAVFCITIYYFTAIAQNVGIGILIPAQKLHVNNGNILLNHINPTFQFQNAGIDKGLIQLAGDHIRIGTNSANNTGNFVIRNNGSDRVTVNATGDMGIGILPDEKLDVDGNIELTGDIKKPATGNMSLLPLCYGKISAAGAILGGSGNFTITKQAGIDGLYYIACTGLSASSTVIATPMPQALYAGKQSMAAASFNNSNNNTSIYTGFYTGGAYSEENIGFHFIIYK